MQQVYILVAYNWRKIGMKRNQTRLTTRLSELNKNDSQALARRFEETSDITSALGAPKRNRLFSPSRTFWLFLWQVLSPDRSCRHAIESFLAWLAVTNKTEASPNSSGYCQARKRLDTKAIERAHNALLRRVQTATQQQRTWCGRVVKVVDGSGLSMPDTPQNQKWYPQSKGQKPGCGFPQMRIVAIFSLATGALLRCATGNKHTHERTLFHQLCNWLDSGDIILADRGFCGYADFYYLLEAGVDSVMRLHQRRTKGVRLLKRLGANDELIQWNKMKPCPKGVSKEQWAQVPSILTVRHVTIMPDIKGFRTKKIVIATTLTDPVKYPAAAITQLYRQRWMCELFLRDIKITMGMDVLRCKTPDMIQKELAMHIIAYNLIRLIMTEAATKVGKDLERISFKATLQALCQWAPRMDTATPKQYRRMYQRMLNAIGRTFLPNRPDRAEPRAKKRRPKNYQRLTKPRQSFKECKHRNHYKKECA